MSDLKSCTCCGKETSELMDIKRTTMKDYNQVDLGSVIRTTYNNVTYSGKIPLCLECQSHVKNKSIVGIFLNVLVLVLFFSLCFLILFGYAPLNELVFGQKKGNYFIIVYIIFLAPLALYILSFLGVIENKGISIWFKNNPLHASPKGRYFIDSDGNYQEWRPKLEKNIHKSRKKSLVYTIIVFIYYAALISIMFYSIYTFFQRSVISVMYSQ